MLTLAQTSLSRAECMRRQCSHCGEAFVRTNNAQTLCSLACRFWAKVERRGPDECWPWTGATYPGGYGTVRTEDGHEGAHRVSWMLAHGPIPNVDGADHRGTCVLHRCDNRRCVNPAHLFLGTHRDNVSDMVQKGRASTVRSNYRYSPEQVRAIRALVATGQSQMSVAAQFGIPQQSISETVRRKTYKDIA
ncbi:MAG TPA: HNH endonuclease [Gemmatimonadaceae bacterium]|nr:HNH endonuclease [Gemmatimonadaceae bacterium]